MYFKRLHATAPFASQVAVAELAKPCCPVTAGEPEIKSVQAVADTAPAVVHPVQYVSDGAGVIPAA